MPSADAAETVIALPLAALSVTLKVNAVMPALPSARLTSLIAIVGAKSSSKIVNVAAFGVPKVAPPVAALSVKITVSSISSVLSLRIGTLKVLLAASPSFQLRVLVVAV